MTQLYTEEDLEILERKYRSEKMFAIAFAGVSFLVFVVLCCITKTGNAALMEKIATVVVMIAGWILIYFYINRLVAGKNELRHGRMLAEEPRETYVGRLTVNPKEIRIKGSIVIKNLTVDTGTEKKRLNVIAGKAEKLEDLTGVVKLETVHGYVAAFGREAAEL